MVLARWCCALILHLALMDEVRGGLDRMKYITNHQYRFEYPFTAFLLCLSEIIMQLVVEWVCILVCCISLAPMAIVFNFIALAIIA